MNSTQDMVFPFPAITVSYKSKNSNAYVHSCGRIFNNLDDKKNNKDSEIDIDNDYLLNEGAEILSDYTIFNQNIYLSKAA